MRQDSQFARLPVRPRDPVRMCPRGPTAVQEQKTPALAWRLWRTTAVGVFAGESGSPWGAVGMIAV